MILKLISLHLLNFKGQRDFFFEPNGNNASAFGDNGAGKTTIKDAFTWLLFGKDSLGKTDFGIKTKDENGEPIHKLEHSVDGVFDVDGKKITLRRVYKEKWVKKQGTLEAVLAGHTTEYVINGEPKKKGEYEAFIAELIGEDKFKLLTDPTYLNEQMDWTKRRDLIFEICGGLSDEEVIASNKELAGMPEMLQGKTVDSCKNIATARQKEIEKKKSDISGRRKGIEAVTPDVANMDKVAITNDITALQKQLQEKQQELVQVQSGGEIAEKKKRLAEIEAQLLRLENDARTALDEKVGKKKKEIDNILQEKSKKSTNIRNLKSDIEANNHTIEQLETDKKVLKDKWYKIDEQEKEVNSKVFDYTPETICPRCNQPMPEEQLETDRQKEEEKFNLKKGEDLTELKKQKDDISKDGIGTAKKIQIKTEENTKTQTQIDSLQSEIEGMDKEQSVIQQEITTLQQKDAVTDAYAVVNKQRTELQQAITVLEQSEDSQATITKLEGEIDTLNSDIKALENAQTQIETRENNLTKIVELDKQEKDLAAEYERLSGELYLCKEFNRAKARMAEEKVNGRFKMARFEMFETQVNGDLKDICETTYNGASYSSELNKGHRNIVGIDIINTLAEYYDFFPPIFVDDAEGTTKLPETKGQIIRLVKPSAFDDFDADIKRIMAEKYGDYDTAKAEYMKGISVLRVEVAE